ncbi:MAG: sll0787 family AIR synthase-like protein [Verrucomicrobia bacterium]|nr:sll0787 family AIR synthase-like protein [Verrucomicrobiota bacterium]
MTQEHTLSCLIRHLAGKTAVRDKIEIERAYRPALASAGSIRIGDDCAALRDGDGYLLFAAEGMQPSFVAEDPWFAGYCAVMVNLSDVAAMGGRPLAVTDVLWTSALSASEEIWAGMQTASQRYAVPIVGGHTSVIKSAPTYLAAAVLGRAKRLITSFAAKPGNNLLVVIDLRGEFHGNRPFWNASVSAPAQRLREDLQLLPFIAEAGWCAAGKDISNGGIIGTLAMLIHESGVGAELCLDDIPRPENVALDEWIISFPSFGYILAVSDVYSEKVIDLFRRHQIGCAIAGKFTSGSELVLQLERERASFPLGGWEAG